MYEMGVVGTKHVPEELMLNDLSSMFEMGTGRLLVKDGVGGTAKTVLEKAAEDSAAAAARKLAFRTSLFLLDFPLYTWVLVILLSYRQRHDNPV
jgi:hypothetical protein